MHGLTCPDRRELSAYLLGDLSEEDAGRLLRHVETCPDCETAIGTLESTSDTLIGRIRQPVPADRFAEEPECGEALARAAESSRGLCDAAPLGQYQLLEKLGRGGMGTVYKARHGKLDRVVALKVLPRTRMADRQAVARFER